MDTSKPNCRWREVSFVAYPVGLWTGFYLYVLLRVRPELFYQQNPAVFLFDSYYFAKFWDQPGGPLDYAAAFLSPLFAYGWLGTAVVTLLTALICLAARWFFAAVTGTGGRFVFLVPTVLIVMVLGRYTHPVSLCVGILAVLGFANVFVRIDVKHFAARLMVFLVMSALVYYVVAGFYVIFALLCGLFEWMIRRRRWLGATCVLCAAIVPVALGMWLSDLGIEDAFRGWTISYGLDWRATPSSLPIAMTTRLGLLLFFPIATVALAWGSPIAALPSPERDTRTERGLPSEATDDVTDRPAFRTRLAVHFVVLVALVLVADIVAFDFARKCRLQMARSADQKRWDDVLAHARQLGPLNTNVVDLESTFQVVKTVFQVNQALFFNGHLLDRMFCYVQVPAAPTLTLRFSDLSTQARLASWESCEVLFQLGLVNESEHMAHEALEVLGDRPQILERLAYIHVLKGHPDAARRFLALLERSLLCSRWARDLLRQLDADPTLSDIPEVASRRTLMIVQDNDGQLVDLETTLRRLLEANRQNRMAFEYLMAHYLLTRQIDKLVANLDRFDDFGDPHLPRHCDEALAIYLETADLHESSPVRREVRPEIRKRCRSFIERVRHFRGNTPAAFAVMYPEFGDTYFFYYVFRRNDPASGQSRSSQ